MMCREANEAHIALLSTLPAHMAQSVALLGAPTLPPGGNEQQQIQNDKMIREFKTLPCGLEGTMASHDHRCCPFFHSERDRRRLVFDESQCHPCYTAEPCDEQFDDQRPCSRGDACRRCHSTAELLYHPDFFRKRLCHQAKRCPRGRFCAFAHSREELLVPHFTEQEETDPSEDFIAWRFKTQWCPIGGPHDWENCVYAHTYRDWRRVPSLGYSSRPCPHWVQSVSKGPAELSYAERCPRGMSCPLAHGAKEQLYHPQFYKTSPCSEANCKRGTLCAFTHGNLDIRQPCQDEQMPASMREPILQAVELLGRSQPTFWSPPRYHALEDPTPKGSSKGRSRGNSIQSLTASPQGHLDAAAQWSDGSASGMDPSLFGADAFHMRRALPTMAGETSPAGCSPYGMASQYPFCQWIPMGSEQQTQLIPPSMGYGQVAETSWTMPMAYTPWACGTYMHQPGAAQQVCMQPGMLGASPFLMTLPMSPQHSDQTNTVLEELTSDQDCRNTVDMSPQSASASDSMRLSFDLAEMPCLAEQAFAFPPELSGVLRIPGLAQWPAASEEEFLARQTNHYLRKGLRTPSSLGSPPISEPATEVPSPRGQHVEADSHDQSSHSSGEAPTLVFNLKTTQQEESAYSTDAATATIEAVGKPLELQNFLLEAPPVPPSPSRVQVG